MAKSPTWLSKSGRRPKSVTIPVEFPINVLENLANEGRGITTDEKFDSLIQSNEFAKHFGKWLFRSWETLTEDSDYDQAEEADEVFSKFIKKFKLTVEED